MNITLFVLMYDVLNLREFCDFTTEIMEVVVKQQKAVFRCVANSHSRLSVIF